MAHTTDHRHRAAHDGAGQLLVVEGPQVFQGTTAPHQQNQVDFWNVFGTWPASFLAHLV